MQNSDKTNLAELFLPDLRFKSDRQRRDSAVSGTLFSMPFFKPGLKIAHLYVLTRVKKNKTTYFLLRNVESPRVLIVYMAVNVKMCKCRVRTSYIKGIICLLFPTQREMAPLLLDSYPVTTRH